MTILLAYGASGAMLFVKSEAASVPVNFAGKNLLVMQP